MRLLITGSTGYLGSRAVDLLANKSDLEIYGIDLNPPKKSSTYKKFIVGSVTDESFMDQAFEEARPDVAVHLAFVVNPMHDRPREEFIDREGMRLFLEGCEKHNVKRIVILSSVAAYGAFADNDYPLTEDSKIRGIQGYAYSWMKAKTDKMVLSFMKDHPESEVVILRPALFVGPNTDNSFFDLLKYPFVPQVNERGELKDPDFQFIHEDDMASCLIEAITKEGIKGAYNVAADGKIKFSQLVSEYGKKTIGVPIWLLKFVAKILWYLRISKVPADQLEFLRYNWFMDNSRMKSFLYEPRIDSVGAFKQFAHRYK